MNIKYVHSDDGELQEVVVSAEQWRVIERFIGRDVTNIVSSSLVVSGTEETYEQVAPISVELVSVQCELICLVISSRTAWVSIFVSFVFDPFPEIMRWLCDIASNSFPAVLRIDEEGVEKLLVAEYVNKKYVKFVVQDFDYDSNEAPSPFEGDLEYPRTYIKTFIQPKLLISSFYNELRSFFFNKCDYSTWERMSYGHATLDFAPLEHLLKSKGLL